MSQSLFHFVRGNWKTTGTDKVKLYPPETPKVKEGLIKIMSMQRFLRRETEKADAMRTSSIDSNRGAEPTEKGSHYITGKVLTPSVKCKLLQPHFCNCASPISEWSCPL